MTTPIQDGWTIARSALLTHQHRLNVTANNIANVHTPGYHRREAILSPVPEQPPTLNEARTWSNGAGVRVVDIVRSYNAMTHSILRRQSGDAAAHDTRATMLGNLESLMREEGPSSLGARLNAFWNAWHDLANQADNIGFRSVVAQRGAELAAHFQSLHTRINDFEGQIVTGIPGDYTGRMPADVDNFNRLTEQLQNLNMHINHKSSGAQLHALMDQRDILLRELSALADIQVGNDFAITLDGETVVSADGTVRNELVLADAGPPPAFELDGTPVAITSGRLGAWTDISDIAAGMRDRLDILAAELIEAVNSIHNSDLNPDGDSFDLNGNRCDWDFFAGTDAATIVINPLIYDPANPMSMDPRLIAAAATRYDDGMGGFSPNPGDGARALQIADLSAATRAALNEQGFGAYHTTGLTLLGGLVATERALATDGDAIINALEDELQVEVGVNLDEELANMLLAQRAFQAGARLLQTVDEMLLTVLQI